MRELKAGAEFDESLAGVPRAERPDGGGAKRRPAEVLHFMRPHQKLSPEPTQHPEPFPVQALPEFLRDYVAAVAESIQVPVDLPASLVLGALSTACARKFRVDVGGLFEEPLGLYIAAGLPSGARKGPTFSEVMSPILWWQRNHPRLQPDLAELLNRALDKIDGASSPEEAGAYADAYIALQGVVGRIASLPNLLYTADVTTESLVRDLAENGNRLGILSPEGGGVTALLLGKYARGRASLEPWLQFYSEEPLAGSRITRKFEALDRPALTIALAVQPEVIRELAASKLLRDRGVVGRFMFLLPEDNIGTRLSEGEPMPPGLRDKWRLLETVALLQPDGEEPKVLEISGEAYDVWRAFALELEVQMAPGGALYTCRDVASKLQGRVARFAGLLHVANQLGLAIDRMEADLSRPYVTSGTDLFHQLAELIKADPAAVPIATETVEAAVELGWYCLSHMQLALHDAAKTPTETMTQRVWEWVRRRVLGEGLSAFTTRDIYRGLHLTDVDRALLDRSLLLLAYEGRIALVEKPRRGAMGRPSSPRWEVL